MKKYFLAVLFVFLLFSQAATASGSERADFHLEFDQMLQLRFGMTYNFTNEWGVRASFGMSPLGPATFSWNLSGVYHLTRFFNFGESWEIDLEAGLPLGYFNFIEDRYVDWDEDIDDPFEGWLPGIATRIGYRFSSGLWGLRLGAASWWEHQRDSGWKGPQVMPIVSVIYEF